VLDVETEGPVDCAPVLDVAGGVVDVAGVVAPTGVPDEELDDVEEDPCRTSFKVSRMILSMSPPLSTDSMASTSSILFGLNCSILFSLQATPASLHARSYLSLSF